MMVCTMVHGSISGRSRADLARISVVSHLDLRGWYATVAAYGSDELTLCNEVRIAAERRGGDTCLCDSGER